MKVFIKEKSWIAKLASLKLRTDNCAIVFMNTIYLHQITKQEFLASKNLLRHEIMHVKQWKREGAFVFLYKYIKYSFQLGYFNNPFEIEARKASLNSAILDGITIS
jgi:hypothetical protein